MGSDEAKIFLLLEVWMVLTEKKMWLEMLEIEISVMS